MIKKSIVAVALFWMGTASAALLEQLTPVAVSYIQGTEFGVFTGSGVGEVTGSVIPVDINLVPPRSSDSGCEAADFAGLDFSGLGDIALIQRGTCTFADKVLNAQAAGAEAVIVFNQGDTLSREGLVIGLIGFPVDIPVVGVSFAIGVALAGAGVTAHVLVGPGDLVPVAEPGLPALLAAALAALAFSRRRRG